MPYKWRGEDKEVIPMRSTCLLLTITLLFLVACTGCASIICGSTKTITVSSNPSGANFSIQNKEGKEIHSGVTPSTVTLKRGRGYFAAGDYTISFTKAGYKPMDMPIKQGLEAGWYVLGNFVFGGLIGWVIVDPLTGAMWTIEDINVDLKAGAGAWLPTPGEVFIVSLDQVPLDLRPKMVRIR